MRKQDIHVPQHIKHLRCSIRSPLLVTLLLVNTGSVLVPNPTGSTPENSNSLVKELLEPLVLHVSVYDMLSIYVYFYSD